MGCDEASHTHCWPTMGNLVIERCEVYCDFCEGPARHKRWKFAWFLRRHVRAVHLKSGQFPLLRCDDDWHSSQKPARRPKRASRSASTSPEVEQKHQYQLPSFKFNTTYESSPSANIMTAPTQYIAPTRNDSNALVKPYFQSMADLDLNEAIGMASKDADHAFETDFPPSSIEQVCCLTDTYSASPDLGSTLGFFDSNPGLDNYAIQTVDSDGEADASGAQYAEAQFSLSPNLAPCAAQHVGFDGDDDAWNIQAADVPLTRMPRVKSWAEIYARATEPANIQDSIDFEKYVTMALGCLGERGMQRNEMLWCVGQLARNLADEISL